MTQARFLDCLTTLGWSFRHLAERLGIDERRVRRWATGALDVPENVMAWLDRLAAAIEADPLPQGWHKAA